MCSPLRPRLAREGLGIIDLQGPSRIGFNEFSPLFASERSEPAWRCVWRNRGTYGDNLVLSGIRQNVSFGAGQFYYRTEGIRPNNQLRRDIENVFVQAALSDRVSLLAEFRHSALDGGDINLLFDPNNFSAITRRSEDHSQYRLGGRFDVTPAVTVVGVWTREHLTGTGTIPDQVSRNEGTVNGDFGEAAIYLSGQKFNVIAGGGYFDSHEKISVTFAGFSFPAADTEITHGNAWVYANSSPLESLHLTIGASLDRLRSSIINRDQINPKFGLSWDIAPGSVFRAAYFETLKRTTVGGQTIEPTQIAGFNQFFDDDDSTRAKRWGVGFDQKIATGLFAGIEWSQRQLNVPIIFVGLPSVTVQQNWKEDFGRPYLDWIVTDRLSVNFGLQWERFVRNPAATDVEHFADLSLARLPVEFRYSDTSGMFALLRMSFVQETGHFLDSMGTIFGGRESFAVMDAGVGWRIPGRAIVGTLQVKNLFNSGFRFQDSDPTNPAIVPHRLVLGRVTFSF